MKKLFSAISAILCVAMLVMSVSAAADDDPYAIFKKAMDKACGVKYAEILGSWKEITEYDGKSESDVNGLRVKLTASPDNKYNAEILEWDQGSEITQHAYIKDGYFYDVLKREKSNHAFDAMEDVMYGIVGTEPGSYRDDIQGLTVQKTPDGYELRYTVPWDGTYYSDDSYTVILNKNYAIESIRLSYHLAKGEPDEPMARTVIKYKFVSINEPFALDFPYDLNQYKLAY